MKYLRDIPDLDSKTVLVRVDFNVPVSQGEVVDDFRIKQEWPTVEFLQSKNAKIILASHYENVEDRSLNAVFKYLKKKNKIVFVENPWSDEGKDVIAKTDSKTLILLENLRFWPGEKENSSEFAGFLAGLADFYVNEAFSASHREHASIVGVPKLIPGFAGLLFENEVKNLSLAFNPPKPFLFILAGAKFETKMPLIEKFKDKADMLFIGGALANNFFKEKGFEIGKSTVSSGDFSLSSLPNDKIFLPEDVIVKGEGDSKSIDADKVSSEDKIMDAGEKTIALLQKLILKSEFIVWNGPLGNYELGFTQGTEELAKCIAHSHRKSVVGGGDTLAAIKKLNLFNKLSFVSTGGGAMLDFLANETLPGIEALKISPQLK